MQQLLQGVNIFLIGMMGTGKTTVGQILAKRLDYRFFDTDVLIERVTGQTINDIFATDGEDTFRDIETQVLAELAPYTKSVIATGGGIILQQKNWSYLHHGLIIWLDSPVDLLIKRLAEDTTRPLLQATDLNLKLASLLEQRRSLYAQGDLQIKINDQQTPDDIVTQILAMIPTVIKPKLEITQNNN
ncbi:shikimate kinase [Crocosphaera sp. XPORK-15E]|uniref:shikimate kinase n=1 Tax=Crocosphaera sp. XPORK-15E TaxID=3110247 RepID=UPI002B21046C|nr:shikimate kinase [Crocosphaera sp. XPORK-15E]MEA5532687.1 shikimate kinase [Crocosphaera sp. XPORK-15E]